MDFETLNEYRKIGFSRKQFGEHAGWRGIGKAAGLTVAEKLIVTTSQGLGKTHQLIFEAQNMLKEVTDLRAQGKNISFSELVEKYSKIIPIESGDNSFTTVELYKIKPEAKELLDKDKIQSHLSSIAPVPFNPKFKYAKRIEKELEEAIEDYIPINLYIDDVQVFKPYLEQWSDGEGEITKIDEPLFVSVYNEKKTELIAFCWYCMHSNKGQIKSGVKFGEVEVDIGGLFFRVHNIRVGDSHLTRKTLFTTTPERALWSVGEIHILDDGVEPTSDRNDFLDNYSRLALYNQSREIALEISRKALKLSDENRAKEKITEADARLKVIKSEVIARKVPKPVISSYIYEVTALKKEAQKRRPKTAQSELKKKADRIIQNADAIVNKLEESLKTATPTTARVYTDVMEDLKVGSEGQQIYNAILGALHDYYANEPSTFEEIVRKIDNAVSAALSA
jgi:molecular chaperone HtpG